MTRVLEWMAALRDHPKRPPSVQRHVLEMLALRLDWQTGCGYASTGQLAADADVDERTVRRSTGWARTAAMLVQTRRGHRLGDGRTLASEWRLVIPQPDRGDLLSDATSTGQEGPVEPISTGQNGNLNRTEEASQPDTTTPPSRPVNHQDLSSSLSAPASVADGDADGERENDSDEDEDEPNPYAELLAEAVPGGDPRDIDWALDSLDYRKAHGEIGSIPAYLRKIIANGDARTLVDDARAERARAAAIPPGYDPFGRPAANGHQAGLRAPAPADGGRPGWCGSCDERTRMRDLDDGRVARCGSCHPAASVAAPALKVIMGEVTG